MDGNVLAFISCLFFFSVFGIICNLGPFSLFCKRICVLNSKKTLLEWCCGFVEQRKIRNEGSFTSF